MVKHQVFSITALSSCDALWVLRMAAHWARDFFISAYQHNQLKYLAVLAGKISNPDIPASEGPQTIASHLWECYFLLAKFFCSQPPEPRRRSMEYAVMPQRGFNPRLCLGWLDELVASHAGSRRPLLSTACDTARCNQPVIEGRDKSRPFFIWPAPSSNIRPDASRRVAPTGASPRHHASLLLRYIQDPWDYNQTRNSGTH